MSAESERTDALLSFGALLAPGTKAGGAATDTISARSYEHQALGARPVVQLVGDTIAPGADVETGLLGFGDAEVAGPVAVGVSRGLGFPASVLVHQPEHATVALAVVDDMKRAARRAKSKPGRAKEQFEAIAKRLTPPILLPSFFEEAGRAFIAADSLPYAATMFEKGREVERTYNLKVDEVARRDAFLEFAFAGALTGKSLTNYATGLSAQLEPAAALDAFIDLVSRRTLGGLPPMADAIKTARKMAKATERDVKEVEAELLTLLLEAPATDVAPMGFWKSARTALIRMAKADPAVNVALLARRPNPATSYDGHFPDWWLELLDDSGALNLLAESDLAVAAEIDAAGWIATFSNHRARAGWRTVPESARLLRLLEDLAPVIKTSDTKLAFVGARANYRAELTDLALELGLEVTDPKAVDRWTPSISLLDWVAVTDRGRRPLEHLAADERFAPLLDTAARSATTGGHGETLNQYPHLQPSVAAAITAAVGEVDSGFLTQARAAIDSLRKIGSAAYAPFPQLIEQVERLDVSEALARQLRVGILDELGWPALEAAIEKLTPHATRYARYRTRTSWPVLTLADELQAIAVGPDGIVAEHRFQPTAIERPNRQVDVVGDDFLVITSTYHGDAEGYWSSQPDDVFTTARPNQTNAPLTEGYALTVDQSLSTGGVAVRPGDRHPPGDAGPIISDGQHQWTIASGRTTNNQRREYFVEFDPTAGTTGRPSVPTWFEESPGPGWVLAPASCSLMPAPDSLSESRLGFASTQQGHADGLVGHRVWRRPVEDRVATDWQIDRIDGESIHIDALEPSAGRPAAIITWPGDNTPRLILGTRSLNLCTPEGANFAKGGGAQRENDLPNRGTDLVAPLAFWHHLQPRDEAGSAILRSADAAMASTLLEPAVSALTTPQSDGTIDHSSIEAAAASIGVTSDKLARGLAGVAVYAARIQQDLSALVRQLTSPEADDARELPDISVARCANGLAWLSPDRVNRYTQSPALHSMLALQQRFVTDDNRVAQLGTQAWTPGSPSPVWMIEGIGALAIRAASPVVADADRETLLHLLSVWSTTIFCQDPTSFFVGTIADGESGAGETTAAGTWAIGTGGRKAGFLERPSDPDTPIVPNNLEVLDRRPVQMRWGTPVEVAEFVAEIRANGPLEWSPDAAAELSRRTGLNSAEAALVWAGCPDFGFKSVLDADQRKVLGLSSKAAAGAAHALIARCDPAEVRAVYSQVGLDAATMRQPLGQGPDDDDSPVARLATAWIEQFGRAVAIDPEAIAEATKLKLDDPAESLTVLANPREHPALAAPAEHGVEVGRRNRLQVVGSPELIPRTITTWLAYVHWAFVHRPVGDSLHQGVPTLIALLRERMTDPGRLLWLGSRRVQPDFPHSMVTSLGQPYGPLDGLEGWISADTGDFIAACNLGEKYLDIEYVIRPSRWDAIIAEHELPSRGPLMTALALLDSLDEFVDRATATPVPEGGYEANPQLSNPKLVAEVAGDRGLDEDAAALYLQYLALLTPTDARIKQWNAWKPVAFKAAGAALLEAGLVVEAKRARAGRKLFLPGEWTAAKAPETPVETWKLSLHRITTPDDVDDRIAGTPMKRWLERRPPHLAFADAWQRVQTDPPEPV